MRFVELWMGCYSYHRGTVLPIISEIGDPLSPETFGSLRWPPFLYNENAGGLSLTRLDCQGRFSCKWYGDSSWQGWSGVDHGWSGVGERRKRGCWGSKVGKSSVQWVLLPCFDFILSGVCCMSSGEMRHLEDSLALRKMYYISFFLYLYTDQQGSGNKDIFDFRKDRNFSY